MEKIISIIFIVIILGWGLWTLIRSYTKPLVPPRKEKDVEAMDKEEELPEEMTSENIQSENMITMGDNMERTEEEMEQMEIQLPDSTTRTSLMVALRKLNLQYEFDDNQNFIVTYQGEHFRILADNDKIWIQVQDLWWYEASLDDIDNLALLHRAVNECNMRDANKMVYTYNQEEHEVGIHTLRDLLWLPQIPNSEQYLQTTFDTMLRSHHFFFRMMEDLRREEFEKSN